MARTFRRQRQSHPISELNVTNLIDLGFTLLIIFMIATPLINQEQTMPMQLPITSKSPSQKQDKELFQAIAIDKNGRYYWGTSNQPISVNDLRQRLGPALERLAARFQAAGLEDPFDLPAQPLGLGRQGVEAEPDLLLRGGPAEAQRLHEEPDRGQGGVQLMGDVGHEVGLEAGQSLILS